MSVWKSFGLPEPIEEYRFHKTRRWKFDLAWPDYMLALEIQGGIWTQGRHTRGAALLKEWEKLNTAAAMGWRVMFCSPDQFADGDIIPYVEEALKIRS